MLDQWSKTLSHRRSRSHLCTLRLHDSQYHKLEHFLSLRFKLPNSEICHTRSTVHDLPRSTAMITFANSDFVSFCFSYLWFPDLWINVMLISHHVSYLNGRPRFLHTSGLHTLRCQKLALLFFHFPILDSPLSSYRRPMTFLDPMVHIFTVLDPTTIVPPPLDITTSSELEYFISIQRLWPLFLLRFCLLDLVFTSGKCCPFWDFSPT